MSEVVVRNPGPKLPTTGAVSIPAMAASLAYFDTYRTADLPLNLTQAQRDFFGAHTYRRVDREGVFHTAWTTPSAPVAD